MRNRDGIETNAVKVIRLKCLDCCCGQISEIENCTCGGCPLLPWRFGKNPYRSKRILSDEDKAILTLRGQALAKRNKASSKDKSQETP